MDLSEAYAGDRVGLAVKMNQLLHIAAGEAPATPAPELFERFVAWVLPPAR